MQNTSPLVRYAALFVVVAYLIMLATFTSIAHTSKNPILAFEFADTDTEIIDIFITDENINTDLVRAVDALNIADFLYLFAYSGFLFIFFADRYMLADKGIFGRGTVYTLIAFGADIAENVFLFRLTDGLTELNFGNNIIFLQAFTTLKWMALSLVLTEVFKFFKDQTSWFRHLAYLFFIPLLAGVTAVLTNKLLFEMIWANSIFVTFGLLLIAVFLPSNRKQTTTEQIDYQ